MANTDSDFKEISRKERDEESQDKILQKTTKNKKKSKKQNFSAVNKYFKLQKVQADCIAPLGQSGRIVTMGDGGT